MSRGSSSTSQSKQESYCSHLLWSVVGELAPWLYGIRSDLYTKMAGYSLLASCLEVLRCLSVSSGPNFPSEAVLWFEKHAHGPNHRPQNGLRPGEIGGCSTATGTEVMGKCAGNIRQREKMISTPAFSVTFESEIGWAATKCKRYLMWFRWLTTVRMLDELVSEYRIISCYFISFFW